MIAALIGEDLLPTNRTTRILDQADGDRFPKKKSKKFVKFAENLVDIHQQKTN